MVIASDTTSATRFQPKRDSAFHQKLPERYWKDLQKIALCYPGYEYDLKDAHQAFRSGEEQDFLKAVRKLRDKQQVYEEYRTTQRQNQLDSLEIAYPGCEVDKQKLQAWQKQHPPSEENDKVFEDMLDGLKHKDAIFFRHRSHPNVKELDALDLDYPGWENDFEEALNAHCSRPALLFADKLHMMKEKQNAFLGNDSHWRLRKLRGLRLTYPEHEEDVKQIEEWHIHNADNAKNSLLFEEALDAMREQQELFLESAPAAANENSNSLRLIDTVPFDSDTETEVMGSCHSRKMEHVEQVEKYYESISKALNGLENQFEAKGDGFGSMDSRKVEDANEVEEYYESISRALNGLETQVQKLSMERANDASSPKEYSIRPEERKEVRELSRPPSLVDDQQQTVALQDFDFGQCFTCEGTKTHAFVPCGHLCACGSCADKLLRDMSCCPICDNHAREMVEIKVTK